MYIVTTSNSFLPALAAFSHVHLAFATLAAAKRAARSLALVGVATYTYCANPAPIPCP